ncbi:hypothetical protein BDQ17DRAFT_1488995 [Cyathus striatus]|nr:hypothetical protein BDQ17DRAFT_1488995 [Cyathus striatus]
MGDGCVVGRHGEDKRGRWEKRGKRAAGGTTRKEGLWREGEAVVSGGNCRRARGPRGRRLVVGGCRERRGDGGVGEGTGVANLQARQGRVGPGDVAKLIKRIPNRIKLDINLDQQSRQTTLANKTYILLPLNKTYLIKHPVPYHHSYCSLDSPAHPRHRYSQFPMLVLFCIYLLQLSPLAIILYHSPLIASDALISPTHPLSLSLLKLQRQPSTL